ncbi:MAG: LamG domain-containing protein [Bacteroidetes bacterium]|nr:LamG domain-containing protein [Bacteroidota bacterium]
MRYLSLILFTAGLILVANSCSKDDPDDYYPTDGLVSYFTFEGDLSDERGNTADGLNIGGVPFTDGHSGLGVTFNGVNQRIEFNRKTFHSGNKVSTAFWFRISSPSSGFTIMYCDDFFVGGGGLYVTYLIYTPTLGSVAGAFTQDIWTHYVGTYDGNDVKIYINGSLTQTANNPGSLISFDFNLTLGSYISSHWAGSIDELLIYNKALTQNEITQLYER